MAQRLVKTLCPKCKKPHVPVTAELNSVGWDSIPDGASFRRPEGCKNCLGTGFLGRMAIFELMKIDEELRSEITRSADSNRIRAIARRNGMRTLLEDGRDKAAEGLTTLAEITKSTRT